MPNFLNVSWEVSGPSYQEPGIYQPIERLMVVNGTDGLGMTSGFRPANEIFADFFLKNSFTMKLCGFQAKLSLDMMNFF
jgi:hypothetical protein